VIFSILALSQLVFSRYDNDDADELVANALSDEETEGEEAADMRDVYEHPPKMNEQAQKIKDEMDERRQYFANIHKKKTKSEKSDSEKNNFLGHSETLEKINSQRKSKQARNNPPRNEKNTKARARNKKATKNEKEDVSLISVKKKSKKQERTLADKKIAEKEQDAVKAFKEKELKKIENEEKKSKANNLTPGKHKVLYRRMINSEKNFKSSTGLVLKPGEIVDLQRFEVVDGFIWGHIPDKGWIIVKNVNSGDEYALIADEEEIKAAAASQEESSAEPEPETAEPEEEETHVAGFEPGKYSIVYRRSIMEKKHIKSATGEKAEPNAAVDLDMFDQVNGFIWGHIKGKGWIVVKNVHNQDEYVARISEQEKAQARDWDESDLEALLSDADAEELNLWGNIIDSEDPDEWMDRDEELGEMFSTYNRMREHLSLEAEPSEEFEQETLEQFEKNEEEKARKFGKNQNEILRDLEVMEQKSGKDLFEQMDKQEAKNALKEIEEREKQEILEEIRAQQPESINGDRQALMDEVKDILQALKLERHEKKTKEMQERQRAEAAMPEEQNYRDYGNQIKERKSKRDLSERDSFEARVPARAVDRKRTHKKFERRKRNLGEEHIDDDDAYDKWGKKSQTGEGAYDKWRRAQLEQAVRAKPQKFGGDHRDHEHLGAQLLHDAQRHRENPWSRTRETEDFGDVYQHLQNYENGMGLDKLNKRDKWRNKNQDRNQDRDLMRRLLERLKEDL